MRIAPMLGGVPEGPAWHRQLLEDMALEIREVRPAVITAASRELLAPFLRFRHLFRNVYAFTLDTARVVALASKAQESWPTVRADVEVFLAFLDGVGAAPHS